MPRRSYHYEDRRDRLLSLGWRWLARHRPVWRQRLGVSTCTVEVADEMLEGEYLRTGTYRFRVHYRVDGWWEIAVWIFEGHTAPRHYYRRVLQEIGWKGKKLTPESAKDVLEVAEDDMAEMIFHTDKRCYELVPNIRASTFKPHMVSDAKRVLRAHLYATVSEVTRRMRYEGPASVFMLPGEDPRGEIGTARHFLKDCEITAFDRHESALAAAKAAGADNLLLGDIDNITRWDTHESLRNRHFRFVNLDLCRTLGYGCGSLINRAGHLTQILAVFVAYGREDRDEMQNIQQAARFHEDCFKYMPPEKLRMMGDLPELPSHILGRVMRLWRGLARPGFHIHHVYLYRGNRVPMLGVLFTDFGFSEEPTVVHRFTNDDLRPAVLRYADTHGTPAAAAAYAVRPETITAWKAVRTREQAEAPTEPHLHLVPPEEPTE